MTVLPLTVRVHWMHWAVQGWRVGRAGEAGLPHRAWRMRTISLEPA